jgi:hypothetical protein
MALHRNTEIFTEEEMNALDNDDFVDASPGAGYLSTSDDEGQFPSMENTIQLAWKPSFADEYKKLLDLEDEGLPPPDNGQAHALLPHQSSRPYFPNSSTGVGPFHNA